MLHAGTDGSGGNDQEQDQHNQSNDEVQPLPHQQLVILLLKKTLRAKFNSRNDGGIERKGNDDEKNPQNHHQYDTS